TVPVKCILELSGLLSQPVIKFNIDLPNSDEELNRALDAVVSTEEMMNRQIISLLIIGKFYAPELIKDATRFGQNDLLAIVSSTLSTQLNNWASQLFEKWNFGVNFRTTGIANTQDYGQEYEFNFLYMPNNRITFNGNVGYRNDKMNPTNFIGDFDFEYKLIQSGKLSLKAYTHTNDYKEFKTGLTTQGIGFVYKENFGSLKELFANWKQSLTPKTPEEKAALKEQRDKEKAQRKAIREWRKRERAEAQAKQDAERKAAKEQKKLEKEQAKKQATKE
nr:translocation/assembly module TamB domain-containing protein [Paludibacteraceae bacterium]